MHVYNRFGKCGCFPPLLLLQDGWGTNVLQATFCLLAGLHCMSSADYCTAVESCTPCNVYDGKARVQTTRKVQAHTASWQLSLK